MSLVKLIFWILTLPIRVLFGFFGFALKSVFLLAVVSLLVFGFRAQLPEEIADSAFKSASYLQGEATEYLAELKNDYTPRVRKALVEFLLSELKEQ